MGLHQRYAEILGNEALQATFSREDEIREELSRLFDGMMKALYKTEGSQFRIEIIESPKVQEFISTHSDALNSAFQQVKMSDTMRQRLQRSNYIFSGMKTFHELNEAFPALIDENGNRKPFEQFLNDVRKIDNTYNKNYLRAEYNFCQASADMAAKWEGFMQDGDRYNLQYRTQRDNKVRPEHAALDRVTLPMSDPFWQEYYPPNGWNCRCTVVQVRKSKFPETPHEEAMSLGEEATSKDKRGIFHFNPGIEQKVFPDYNPYTIKRCKDCDIAKGKIKLTFVPDSELCAICKSLRKGLAMYGETRSEGNGTVTIHQFVNRNDSDFKKLNEIATFFAREQGAEVILTPKMSRPQKFQYECIYGSLIDTVYEGKCPDIWVNGVWYEHEGFISTNPKNAFRNMMRDGLIQCDRLIIDRPDLTERFMLRSIIGRVKRGEAIKEVWLREKDGTVKLLYKNTDG